MHQAAMLAVPHFLQYDDDFRAERQRRGRLVMELLDGVSAPGHRLAEIGLSRAAVLAVVCIAPMRTADQPRPDLIERIATHLSLTCESFHRPAAVAWVGDKAYALVEVPDGTGEAIDRIVQESVRRSTGLAPGGTVGGSSRPNPRLRGLPARRLEAEDVVTLLRSRPELGATGDYPSLQPYVLLNRTLAAVSESGDARLPGLDQLADHDTEKRTDYIRSLLAYFHAGGNVTSAARALDVHPTTLRYRLEQARRISGLQLDEHDVQLACELALRAHRESPP
jgi:DNA-binding PucR family transcriptional regulator